MRWLGDRSSAEDLTQDVFLRVHQALPRYREGHDPWPWLVSIARNLLVDALRSAQRMERPTSDLEFEANQGEPSELVLRREKEDRVRRALARLPEDQRQTVLLRNFAGLSHAEIARQLGLSDLAVRKRYSRALATLARQLREAMP